MTRDQIGTALEYSDPTTAISKLHSRHSERLNKFSVVVTLVGTDDKFYNTTLYNAKGVYEVCRWSRQEKADEFIDWAWDILEKLRTTGQLEGLMLTMESKVNTLQSTIEHQQQLLIDSGIIRQFINPRYTFERLNTRYKIATNDDSKRGIHEAIGNYFGFHVPYSSTLPITLRDWVLQQISEDPQKALDSVQEFIIGLESATIIKSIQGKYVNLNGFGSNTVEWSKVLKYFGNSCAYCGRNDIPLIPEHIVSQSYLAQSNPGAVDLVGNIVCADGICNHSKGTEDVDEWYMKQPYYEQWRLEKIHKWQAMHRLEEF